MHTRSLSLALALLCWIVNPAFIVGCGADEPSFTFGEADLVALMETLNEGTWELSNDAGDFQLDLDLQQGSTIEVTRARPIGVMSSAHACGNREFVSSASACMDLTFFGLEGLVTITDASNGAQQSSAIEVSGVMEVVGLNLTYARVTLTHSAGEFVFASTDDLSFLLEEARW